MVDEKLTNFIHYLRFEKRYSSHTITAYQTDLLQFYAYLLTNFQLSDILSVTHFHIRSWLASMKEEDVEARSLNRKISSLNSFYKYLLRLGRATTNPVKQLHAMKVPSRLPTWLKENETESLLDEIQFDEGFRGATDRMICELLYATGMRRNELQELKENNIECSLSQIRILGKGNKERLVPVNRALLETIKDYIEAKKQLDQYGSDHLLVLESGEPLYAGYIYRVVKRYLTSVTTLHKKSPHVLRHTFATHLLGNGANIQAIKDLLGHSSLASTQVYTHNNIAQLKQIHQLNHPRG